MSKWIPLWFACLMSLSFTRCLYYASLRSLSAAFLSQTALLFLIKNKKKRLLTNLAKHLSGTLSDREEWKTWTVPIRMQFLFFLFVCSQSMGTYCVFKKKYRKNYPAKLLPNWNYSHWDGCHLFFVILNKKLDFFDWFMSEPDQGLGGESNYDKWFYVSLCLSS